MMIKARRFIKVVPMLGLLFAGAAVGAGFGLLLAPTPGRRLRHGMGHRIGRLRERVARSMMA
jgi:gas vesicle protein